MAESIRQKVLGKYISRTTNEASGKIECAVCLQSCVHPAELPCGHIFCYLCIKGIVTQGRRCAMCRQSIPVDYLEKPRLLKPVDSEDLNQGFDDGHLWFYEGHNGWWQYDERTCIELETAYQKKERCCELLIAGFLYIADFDAMLQYRRNDPSKRRRIKRDLATTVKKGVAGLKATKDCTVSSNNSNECSEDLVQREPNFGSSTVESANDSAVNLLDNNINTNTLSQQDLESQQEENLPIAPSVCNVNSVTNSSSNSHARSNYNYSRNFDLDNLISRTLDCTIEEIESLNLELLSDYEVLFRGVNNPNTLCNNRSRRLIRNYLSQYLNSENRLNIPVMSEMNSHHTSRDFSQSNQLVRNRSPLESFQTISRETPSQLPTRSREVTGTESQLLFHGSSTSLSRET